MVLGRKQPGFEGFEQGAPQAMYPEQPQMGMMDPMGQAGMMNQMGMMDQMGQMGPMGYVDPYNPCLPGEFYVPCPEEKPQPQIYVVQKGDSVYKIAQKFGLDWRELAGYNHLGNPDLIYPGERLFIPPRS